MLKEKLKKLNNDQLENIGGAGFAAIVPFIPLIVNSIGSILASIKMFTSSSGEYKTKDTTQKWNSDTKSSNNNNSSSQPIYIIQY
ncbi:hypothetical protein [Mesomycoplasma neurolyticum]|uniref:Uncharacterized protein n=1 Tax=Mesomycoplasma neurolyticum TaxID=2120 RepID=A0A449A5D3_9BACT|nr:hypothetical protein [Mesomycoplasma neurolyticum]VEU59439.1 Uncharacterised protein [Mesomycoplasma neurolyticum]